MHGHILVALLETVVLLDEVQVISPDHDCALHLRGDGHSLDDLSADAHSTCERALLVHILALLCLLGRGKPEANVLPITLHGSAALLAQTLFRSNEDCVLFLERFLGLIHDCSVLFFPTRHLRTLSQDNNTRDNSNCGT